MARKLNLLHAASRWLEDSSGRHEHSIALLEAVATTAAVIVALAASYAAKRMGRPQLKAAVSVMQIIYGDGRPLKEAPTYVAVRLTNVGAVPIRLHSTLFSWVLPFEKSAWLAMPEDESGDGHVTQRRYPFALMPRTSETLFFTAIERLKTDMPHSRQRAVWPENIGKASARDCLHR